MNIREMAEQREADYLSPYASLSRNSRGRDGRNRPAISARFIREIGTGFFIQRPSGGLSTRPRSSFFPRETITGRG